MKCLIIEDEIPAQKILKNYLGKLPDYELVAVFQSAIEANAFLKTQAVDLIFLDINLPDINGLQYIKTLSNPPAIIMTTAYTEHAAESFELDTICDYLVKPFSFERFFKALNKVPPTPSDVFKAPSRQQDSNSFIISIDKAYHRIVMDEIVYIVSDKNYVTIALDSQKLTYIESLKNWVAKLPESQFVQVHKSFLVNLGKVRKISGNQVVVGQHKIPVGRKYKPQLLRKLNAS